MLLPTRGEDEARRVMLLPTRGEPGSAIVDTAEIDSEPGAAIVPLPSTPALEPTRLCGDLAPGRLGATFTTPRALA